MMTSCKHACATPSLAKVQKEMRIIPETYQYADLTVKYFRKDIILKELENLTESEI